MAERITTVQRDTAEQPTVVVSESRGSGASWLIGIVVLIALVAAVVIFTRTSDSEAAKDNAIANAAGQVGNAASQVGNAAQDAANNMKQ